MNDDENQFVYLYLTLALVMILYNGYTYYAFIILLIPNFFVIVLGSIHVATILPSTVKTILEGTNVNEVKNFLNGSRRILEGEESRDRRPYMVYLKLPANNPRYKDYRSWLCGGVIVHDEYILTSAACIEDAHHFYVVSGTYRHTVGDDRYNNLCIKNGAKKAVWKCIPRNYVFDGHENDNIRWMNNDIAIVKVEDEFDFTRRIRGCDFVPKPICYNNISSRYENAGQRAVVAGWGSTDKYGDLSATQDLMETSVVLISKETCKRHWGKRYHNIIDNYMICSKDTVHDLSELCNEKYVDCKDMLYSGEDGETRRVVDPKELVLHSAHHNETRRSPAKSSGGFCENDHGGPMIYSNGNDDVVIGIISACLVRERSNKCYGPFLYTSVYKNRMLINCAIYKDVARDCSKVFRSGDAFLEQNMSWVDHPDGPAKNELAKMRRNVRKENTTTESNHKQTTKKIPTPFDKAQKHEGVVLRTFGESAEMRKENKNSTK